MIPKSLSIDPDHGHLNKSVKTHKLISGQICGIMRTVVILMCLFLTTMLYSQSNSVGVFQFNRDIGNPKNAGSAYFDETTQTYTLKGGGYNIWFDRDEFRYLYNKISGDFILTANFAFRGQGSDPHRKIGWMIRESEDEQAAHFSATLHGDGLTVAQWRGLRGAFMRDPQDQIYSPKHFYGILQLERQGKKLTMRAAHWGEPLQTIGSHSMEHLPDTVLAGLFICAHQENVREEAQIWNVRIDRPVADDYNPREGGWLGCRLETINVFNGKRKVIFEKDDRFEAPNWMPDGKQLLFNMEGSLYKIPVDGGALEKLNTGFATRNNNDHGISFNGKLLAISHHREGLSGGGSTVYVLPIEGGTPKQVTEHTPSYWHGWAPNNKEVVYVAQREGSPSYDIYKNSIHGGASVIIDVFTVR